MLVWVTTTVAIVLIALLFGFGGNLWGSRVKLTPEYVAGIIAGIGIGLALCPVLITSFGADPKQLTWPGFFISAVGGCLALYAQKRAARGKLATR